MKQLVIYTETGGDGPVVRWQFEDDSVVALGANVALLVDKANIPVGFETTWMDFEVFGGILQIIGTPLGETEQLSNENTDYPPSIVRMNDHSIFARL